MAFERDHGSCCCCLPLKFGVGLISMYIWIFSLIDCMALLEFSKSNQVRLMAGGYHLSTMKMNSLYGSFGLVIGFLGLLGIYDDKLSWIRIFANFVYVRLVLSFVVFLADVYTLTHDCEAFAANNAGNTNGWSLHTVNAPLHSLSENGLCHEATKAYCVGFAVDVLFNIYLCFCLFKYTHQLAHEPPYAIDFGASKKNRWDFYRINEVPFYANQRQQSEEGVPLAAPGERPPEDASYGSIEYSDYMEQGKYV